MARLLTMKTSPRRPRISHPVPINQTQVRPPALAQQARLPLPPAPPAAASTTSSKRQKSTPRSPTPSRTNPSPPSSPMNLPPILSAEAQRIQAQPILRRRPKSLSPPQPPFRLSPFQPPFPHRIGRVRLRQQRLRHPLRHHPPSPALRCKHVLSKLLSMLYTDLIADGYANIGRIPLTLFTFAYARGLPTVLRTEVDVGGRRPQRLRIAVWIVGERERSSRPNVNFLLPFVSSE